MTAGPPCGAPTRAGAPCRAPGTRNGRCRQHPNKGGAPLGNKNAVKHGIYASGVRESELDVWHEIPLATLDDEIRLCRLQLRRAFADQARADAEPGDMTQLEVSSIEDHTETRTKLSAGGKGGEDAAAKLTTRSIKRGRPDYRLLIHRLTGRIADLEMRRLKIAKELRDTNGAGSAALEDLTDEQLLAILAEEDAKQA